MNTTPHETLVRALAQIDQLVASAQSLANGPEADTTLRLLVLLKEMQVTIEVAEVALGAMKK